MKIDLNIFTNCTESAPKTDIIKQTYKSFCDTFGVIEPTIWMDKNPNIKKHTRYFSNLKTDFKNVNYCYSMSDGYIKAVENSDADYLFMLEHDWIFKKENIKHDLNEICEYMDIGKIYHLRFNKRNNIVKLWDKYLHEKEVWIDYGNMRIRSDFCITPVLSNNPHIINRKIWLEKCRKHVKIKPGSKGIEELLTARPELNGAIYGGLNYPATVKHLDGRKNAK